MELSHHAEGRIRQRGIPMIIVDLLIRYGVPNQRRDGAAEIRITHKAKAQIIADVQHFTHELERLSSQRVLVGYDQTEEPLIVALYHKT